MDLAEQRALLPHYAAIFVLTGVVLWGLRVVLGTVPFWLDAVGVVALVLAYPTIVRTLGVAPDVWERS